MNPQKLQGKTDLMSMSERVDALRSHTEGLLDQSRL